MSDTREVTESLLDLYEAQDFTGRMNFRAFWLLSGMRRLGPGARVLDAGCGPGLFLAFLRSQGMRRVRGLDSSEEMARRGEKVSGCPISVGDALRMDELFGEGAFDAVAALNIQHHLGRGDAWDRFAAGCRRVLAPGGFLFAREPWPTPLMRLLLRMSFWEGFHGLPVLSGRLKNLAAERRELEAFFSGWPPRYRQILCRNGFSVEKELTWMGHRIVAARAVC